MNILKLLTRSGRQELVREAATDYLTPDTVAELAAEGVANALEAGAEKIGDERRAQIALGCQMGGNALIHLTAAVSPESEDGAKVSPSEKALITTDIKGALGSLLTKEAIATAIAKCVKYVPVLVAVLAFGVSGCVYKGAKVTEGTDLAIGLNVPVSEGTLQLQVLNYLSGFRLGVDRNAILKCRYTVCETNSYLGVVRTNVSKTMDATVEPCETTPQEDAPADGDAQKDADAPTAAQ